MKIETGADRHQLDFSPHETARIICFHGSPGSPEDFAALNASLTKTLSNLNRAIEFMTPTRPAYPGHLQNSLNSLLRGKTQDVFIGYSWGAAYALKYALEASTSDSAQPIRLIMVAPYLFPFANAKKKPSSITKMLLKTPGISTLLLSLSRSKIEEKFIRDTSHPTLATPAYKTAIQSVMTPGHLKAAVLEKESIEVSELLKSLKMQNLKLLIVSGKEDLVSVRSEQLVPLTEALVRRSVNYKLIDIESAGHNLLWTHAEMLSECVTRFLVEESL